MRGRPPKILRANKQPSLSWAGPWVEDWEDDQVSMVSEHLAASEKYSSHQLQFTNLSKGKD